MIEMKVSGVILEPQTKSPIVVLRDDKDRRALLIWVGEAEANAILLGLEGVKTPRPLTHDLFTNVLSALHAPLTRIRIHDMKNNTFFAELEMEIEGRKVAIDSRPSDAIALALRQEVPILVEEQVMEHHSIPISKAQPEEDEDEAFKRFIENVKPSDFGRPG